MSYSEISIDNNLPAPDMLAWLSCQPFHVDVRVAFSPLSDKTGS